MKFPAESYTKDECKALIATCPDTWYGFRDRTLIILLWRSGLRLAEALALRRTDIDFSQKTIRVLHGKNDKARTVAIDYTAAMEVYAWYVQHLEEFPEPETKLICTRQGKPLRQAYVRRMLPELAKKAHVDKRVHAHGFRHTYAVELMREGVSVKNIQILLGHASLQVTSIYLASLSPEEALDAVRGREW